MTNYCHSSTLSAYRENTECVVRCISEQSSERLDGIVFGRNANNYYKYSTAEDFRTFVKFCEKIVFSVRQTRTFVRVQRTAWNAVHGTS